MTDPTLFLLAEAAERTGLSVDALRKRIKRGALEMVKGNDGLVRVRLTAADMDAVRLAGVQPTPSQPESSTAIKVLEEAVGLLRDQLGRERAALESETASLRAWAEGAEERLQAASRRLEEERSRAAAEAVELRTAGEEARLQAARAEEKAEGLRLALEEARRPFWRR